MTSRIESINVAPTSESRAEPGRFSQALRAAAGSVATGIAAGVQLAAPYVPGGTVLSAAVRGAAQGSAVRGASASAALAAGGSAKSSAAAAAAGADGGGDVIEATRALQQEAQTFNLQYLQLQESMQRESREFTALSNVMKVKHDSAKSAINNIH